MTGTAVRSDRQAVAATTDRCAVCAAVQVVLVACSGIAAVSFASSTALSRSSDTVLTLIACRNWDQFIRTITFQWSEDLQLAWRPEPLGTATYVWWYATLMLVVAVIPYTEELIRCWKFRNRCAPPKT